MALFVVMVALALSLAWNAGEMHRRNCQREGRLGCSALPWDNGRPRPVSHATPTADCILYSENCP